MADRNLSIWVSDQLYALLGEAAVLLHWGQSRKACHLHQFQLLLFAGYSEDALVSFILTLARKATSASGLASKLQDQVCPGPFAQQAHHGTLQALHALGVMQRAS